MRRTLLAVFCLAAVGAGLWLWRDRAPAPKPAPAPIAAAPAPAPTRAAPLPTVPAIEQAPPDVKALAAALSSGRLDPKTDEFRERLDELIPARLYAEAAKCYEGGQHRNQKLKVSYRMKIEDGQVSISNVHILKNTLTDRRLERCFVAQIEKASFRDDKMPDWESEEELLIRIRGLKKHMPVQGEDEDADVLAAAQ